MFDGLIIKDKKGKYTINIDTMFYSIDTAKKASYKFTNSCSFLFKKSKKNEIKVILEFIQDLNDSEKKDIIKEFCNEMLDQSLREKISKETESIRNLILAQAFSRTSLIDE